MSRRGPSILNKNSSHINKNKNYNMYNTTTMILLSLSLLAATRLGVFLTASLAVIRLGKAGVREGGGRCSSSMGM